VDVCNSSENASSIVLKCRADGTAPVAGATAAGDALLKGQCARYEVGKGTTVKCIAASGTVYVTSYECVSRS
jgi:hypothetical protein